MLSELLESAVVESRSGSFPTFWGNVIVRAYKSASGKTDWVKERAKLAKKESEEEGESMSADQFWSDSGEHIFDQVMRTAFRGGHVEEQIARSVSRKLLNRHSGLWVPGGEDVFARWDGKKVEVELTVASDDYVDTSVTEVPEDVNHYERVIDKALTKTGIKRPMVRWTTEKSHYSNDEQVVYKVRFTIAISSKSQQDLAKAWFGKAVARVL